MVVLKEETGTMRARSEEVLWTGSEVALAPSGRFLGLCGNEDGDRSLRPQVCVQKSTSLLTMGPLSARQHSSQVSQLRLQEGMKPLRRSTIINFGCMTLKGRKNILLIFKSSPNNRSGGGSPSFETHSEGGYIYPSGEEVWNSFCRREREEKHKRTLILDPSLRASALPDR